MNDGEVSAGEGRMSTMNVPNLPHPEVPIISENGKIHDSWYRFFTQLTSECQNNLSEEGLNIPTQTTNDINTLQTANPLPSFVYDSNKHAVMVAINGVYKTVQVV